MLMTQLQDANLRQSVMQYINQTANALDKDANSKALIETLARESVHNQKSSAVWKSRTKKSVAAGVVAVVLAITVQFLVNYFSNELSKESHVDKQGAMVSTDGRVVKTQMEDMKVGADGALLSRNGDATVKTMPSLAKVALDSSLPDATLMALEEISVHSEKGYTLQIKVHGFSRVPVLNSRCGNVVHFYTAWKGKVTLDSTDLLLDEATAAEFRGAGFSMATGGRRLADEISLDAFVRAVGDMKRSGKWTCANVALPIVSAHASSEVTRYTRCRTKKTKKNTCYSEYGGLMLGVTALEEIFSPIASQTDQLYQSSRASTMKSALYTVFLQEYPMHPGQQLVKITAVASDTTSRFQIESDHKRSHCSIEVKHTNIEDDKIDSDWHMEYMGISEVDGKILRGFNVHMSSEWLVHTYGDALNFDTGGLAFAQFWDVADNMEPYAYSSGDMLTMYRSYKSVIMTDAEMETTMKTLSGRNVAELLSCTDDEKGEGGVPTMGLADLNREDIGYYAHSSAEKSESFSKYLEDATNDDAMSDFCYESCKVAVDAFRSSLVVGDVCQDGVAEAALSCLEHTRSCESCAFINEHRRECDTTVTNHTNGTRALDESEEPGAESGEPVQLLVNETWLAQSEVESRRLHFPACERPNGISGPCDYTPVGVVVEASACYCWQFQLNTGPWGGFVFTLVWGLISGKLGIALELEACSPAALLFTIPDVGLPVSAKLCVGGGVAVVFTLECPWFPFKITANAFLNLSFIIGFTILGVQLTYELAKVEIGLTIGIAWLQHDECTWALKFNWHQGERRRWPRRRLIRVCEASGTCDFKLTGYISLTLLAKFKVQLNFIYWFRSYLFQINVRITYDPWDWEFMNYDVYERDFKDYADDNAGNAGNAFEDNGGGPLQWMSNANGNCGWRMHWGKDAQRKIPNRWIWTNWNLRTAKVKGMRACLADGRCTAVVCWSTQPTTSSRTFVWKCQLRKTCSLFLDTPPGNPWRVRTYTPETQLCRK